MSGSDKSKTNQTSHVSLFPAPPWQLINKLFSNDTPPRPPTPPGSSAYRMFGNFYNSEDAILRSLESQGVRRVYPQTYNRKRELRKINFSILANYLDLLDIITRDPSSPKRTEKLDHLAILFINMHHLVNEYRQHQARDLLREILKYQVNIGAETVEKAEQYLTRADEQLKTAANDLIIPGTSTSTSGGFNLMESLRNGLNDLGPELTPLLQTVLDETLMSNPVGRCFQPKQASIFLPSQSTECFSVNTNNSDDYRIPGHIDMALWDFLFQTKNDSEMDIG
ncbi:Mediator of RNA polymerase II transcription subunit 7 [Schistosoma japonicum]|uniref:Mediator of RNA polymerase II transcription subunit 7 n=1 Tax=Schistosoma japonicum TaxID=6182 RepID=A0A4Z2DM87_SCHJA|nr:Mediator of RNA polymerase II transcription subunit 7 [Schistosoma japonicum]KAH8875693.1 Mediator of RNA polymerase II transcription subunit 7 [Schistosoma japonicum]TNN17250.1 Mediator of RNA polymerase II transcription subunit 7 [Schistosoma japonicum]